MEHLLLSPNSATWILIVRQAAPGRVKEIRAGLSVRDCKTVASCWGAECQILITLTAPVQTGKEIPLTKSTNKGESNMVFSLVLGSGIKNES